MKKQATRVLNRILAGFMAVVLVVCLGGIGGKGGSVYAQKPTLPGIEKIVEDAKENGNVYTMLEVVADKSDASLGYLIGGQEPYYMGKALEDMPSVEERAEAVNKLESNLASISHFVSGGDAMLTYELPYAESDSGVKTQKITGSFADESGDYLVEYFDPQYELRVDSTTPTTGVTRYDKRFRFEDATTINTTYPHVVVTYASVDGSQNRVKTIYDDGTVTHEGVAYGRYNISFAEEMSAITPEDFVAENYVGKQVYILAESTDAVQYGYRGDLVWGSEASALSTMSLSLEEVESEEEATVSAGDATVSAGDAVVSNGDGIVSVENSTVSGSDAETENEDEGITELDDLDYSVTPLADSSTMNKDIYVYNPADRTYHKWATYSDSGYMFNHVSSGHIVTFESNPYGDYYISNAVNCSGGNMVLIEFFEQNDEGEYIQTSAARVDYTYKVGQGNSRFYSTENGSVDEVVIYDGGFTNAEWFKKHVLDLDNDNVAVDVRTVTVAELCNMVNNGANYGFTLDEVDFAYFATGNYGSSSSEQNMPISMLTAYLINNDIPTVMEYSFLTGSGNTYLTKMAQMLMLNQSKEVEEEVMSFDGTQGIDTATDYGTQVSALFTSQQEILAGHVYVNDDAQSAYVSNDYLFDWNDTGVDALLADVQEKKLEYYAPVLSEIAEENFLRDLEGAEKLEMMLSKATITRYIVNFSNQRVTVKDEIKVLDIEPCYAALKDGTSQWLTKSDIVSWMPDSVYDGNISMTQMSSSEFIGRIEDLNATYDLIYVGDSTLRFNTDSSGNTIFNDSDMNGLVYYNIGDAFSYANESGENQYRLWDPDVSGSRGSASYRASGNDINTTRQEEFLQYIRAGYAFVLADSLVDASEPSNVKPNAARVDVNSRFYKVIETALSKSSDGKYLYYGRNVFTKGMLTGSGATQENKDTFAQYLNLSKLQIVYQDGFGDSKPVSYLENYSSSRESDRFMKKNTATGYYELQYIFSLRNYAAVSQVKTTYDCKLYVDNNADGRYTGSDYSEYSKDEDSEELESITIYRMKNGDWEKVPMSYEASKNEWRYDLTTGVIYKLVRELPDNYQGLLPWKLVFYDNANPLVRCSEIGYSAVRSELIQTIKVIQLGSDRTSDMWNLGDDSDVKAMLPYVKETTGFDIQLTCVDASDFIEGTTAVKNAGITFRERKNGESDYEYYYGRVYDWIMDEENCNMLILGFDDNYTFGNSGSATRNMAAAEAIRDYIESGRSILFTHDSSSYINYDKSVYGGGYGWYWGYEFNKTMRAAVGLDRYGALARYYEQMRHKYSGDTDSEGYQRYDRYLKILTNGQEYQYDTAYKPGSEGATVSQIEGLTDATVVRKLQKDLEALRDSRSSNPQGATNDYFYAENSLFKQALYRKDSSQLWYGQYKAYDNGRLKATPVNEGQVTMFPYLITDMTDDDTSNDYLTVAQTHNQWLQPNMELDRDGDGKNDIVVWYCLSDLSSAGINAANGDGNHYYNMYNLTPNDVVNNYYIYNMGNVTYSGVGHSRPDTVREKQLFVNTMVAAYASGTRAPVMDVMDMYDNSWDSIYLMFDEANKFFIDGIDKVEGSILVTDYNILGGDVQARVEFFVSDEDGDIVSGIDDKVRKFSSSNVKVVNAAGVEVAKTACDDDKVFNGYFDGGYYILTPGQEYKLEFAIEELGLLEEGAENGSIEATQLKSDNGKIIIRVTTVYSEGELKTPNSTKEITVGVAGLFDLK